MRNALSALLHRHRLPPRLGLFIGDGRSFSAALSPRKAGLDVGIPERQDRLPVYFRCFSTAFTSVHGEKPSSEYARQRKQSLETLFGHILGRHGSKAFFAYSRFGPFLALYRAAIIFFQVAKLTVWHFFVQDIDKRAAKFRETLISLGPFYIKLGQALSTRPDILPKAYCQELSKLQDRIPPFPSHIAIKSLESQLGAPIFDLFYDISPEPIAAASLGQVYKVMQLIYILGSLWPSKFKDLVWPSR